MLVLTRKSGESIYIGDDIIITVVEIRGGQVKVGVEAPESVGIYRKELFDKIKKENIEAGKSKESLISALAKHFNKGK